MGHGPKRLLALIPAVVVLGIWQLHETPQSRGVVTESGFPAVGAARFLDRGTGGALKKWGSIECADPARVRRVRPGGDPFPLPNRPRARPDGYRQLRVIDGDNYYGERCELGRNDYRVSPVALYHEGERLLTFASIRLPRRFPLHRYKWQVALQMKQAQPSDGNGYPTPILALNVFDGRWRLYHTDAIGPRPGNRQVWSARARKRIWVRFAFDITYSVDPSLGSVRVWADLNGDGDALDSHERSRRMGMQTLAQEGPGTSLDGLVAGASIPSHLRIGIYHDPAYPCTGSKCTVSIDSVGVFAPP